MYTHTLTRSWSWCAQTTTEWNSEFQFWEIDVLLLGNFKPDKVANMEERESKYARNKQHNMKERMQWFIFMSYTYMYTQRRAHWDKTRQGRCGPLRSATGQSNSRIYFVHESAALCAGHAHMLDTPTSFYTYKESAANTKYVENIKLIFCMLQVA